MARRNLSGLRLLVTGASQGIGRAIAVAAAAAGCKVIASARSAELLAELAAEVTAAGGTLVPVAGDVTQPHDRDAMLAAAVTHFGGLDVLVNNAGIGATGHFMDTKPDTLRQIFETNLFAAAELIRVCLPTLKQGTTPAVVTISSVLGKRAWPARGLYSASKFALHGLSDAIRAELAPHGVSVIVVSPGLTRTNFSKNMLEQKAMLPLDHLRGMTPEAVAASTLRAIERDTPETTLTFRGKLLVLVNRAVPWVIDYFAKKRIRRLFAAEIAARRAI